MSDALYRNTAFRVSSGRHLFESLICGSVAFWVQLGRLESDLLLERIEGVPIDSPVYVSGLARSGTTILLELLAAIEGVVTHRYKDFPPVLTPFFWNELLGRLPKKNLPPVERTHQDGIMITPDSPEAFEEVLWMAFFPRLHDPTVGNVLDEHCDNPRFEAFYRDHIRKLLLVRGGTRYVAKGNYNVTRLRYLRKLLPDSRFLLVVREPAGHIASLVRQHALFCAGGRANPRAVAHLRRVGHFEFGLDRRPINTGDDEATLAVIELWRQGDEIRAWARYWSQIYGYLADLLAGDEALREASVVVRYEDLCREPEATLSAVLEHCRFARPEGLLADLSGRVRPSSHGEAELTTRELDVIRSETGEVAGRLGY